MSASALGSSHGFALAAALAGDGDARLAAPGLCTDAREALCRVPAELARMTKVERRERIQRIALGAAQARAHALSLLERARAAREAGTWPA
ncbi:MAG TPA: hypothetical protein VHM19_03115 [Polyangiales bacterium]|jgi:hypothetical protein|nr:hypothetical protein [Polyangiales bacterium]